MTRRADEPCASCRRLIWWNPQVSSPRGSVVCNACAKAGWVARDGVLDNRSVICPGCAWPFVPKTKGAAGGRTAACSQMCAAQARRFNVPRTCLACADAFSAASPNAAYCPPCSEGRRRDHYRRKNRSRAGYTKAIRAFPISELGDRDGWRCHICRRSVDRFLSGRHPGMASYDHVIPTSLGGSDDAYNLKLAHLQCNIRKSNKSSAIVTL